MAEQAMTTKKNTNSRVPEGWEIDAIGSFLLELYHKQVISYRQTWLVEKARLREEFRKFLNLEENNGMREKFELLNGTADIGTLLHRTYYLINTPRQSNLFRIKHASLYQYRNKILDEYDEKRKNGGAEIELQLSVAGNDNELANRMMVDPALVSCFETDAEAPSHELAYQGAAVQRRDANFQLSNMGCPICQLNFEEVVKFEEHVEEHSDESDFKLMKDLKKSVPNILKLSYQLCKNSHYFCFTMESAQPNIVIERIIIVQTRSMYHVNKMRVPYAMPANGKDVFFVDSHLFTISLEQPIIIVFHEEFRPIRRVIEQHHFMRVEDFPTINIGVNPCRLPNKKEFKTKFQLVRYLPPKEIRDALKNDNFVENLCNMSNYFREYLASGKVLTPHNMQEVMTVLLQIEDMDTLSEYFDLIQRNVTLRKFENEYILKLQSKKGVFYERVISVFDEVLIIPESAATFGIKGNPSDDLLLRNTDNVFGTNKKKQTMFFGQVERVANRNVTFVCINNLKLNETYMIIFRPARLPLRYQYRAVSLMASLPSEERKRLLFPECDVIESPELPDLSLYNKQIANNPEQLQAVQHIVANAGKNAPYIIFGPPGTGKTTTLVEAILQVYATNAKAKILVTAGSNGACDEVALRLINVLSKSNDRFSIVRIYSRTNEKRSENIDELLLEYSNMYGLHFYPDIDLLHQYRIVVCTLSTVGKLSLGKFGKNALGRGIYSHVFIDEAASTVETEALIGFIGPLAPKASLILSGDHKQLGAVLNSRRAEDLGLGISLMERLLARDCYKVEPDGSYDRFIQIRLRRNYRSHPEIVNLYNKMYYDNELISMANDDVFAMGQDWHRSPNPDYPIIFHSAFGTTERESNGSSYHNSRELEIAMDYVKDLLKFGINGRKINQEDIGIISPYKKQYQLIREELNLRNWYHVETGAVETFQGKEKEIIIVSFVRSFTKTLGFLQSPRRLNVTISRPKSLLLLIGNPKTLSINDDFKHIIQECQNNRTMVGALYYELSDGLASSNRNLSSSSTSVASNKRASPIEMKTLNETLTNVNLNADAKTTENKIKKKKKKANKKVATPAHNNVNGTTDDKTHTHLGHSMKKSVKPISQEKQRNAFGLYRGLLSDDEQIVTETIVIDNAIMVPSSPVSTTSPSATSSITVRTVIDDIFDELPRVSEAMSGNTTPNTQNAADELKQMEKQLHEQMLKLKLKPPVAMTKAINSETPIAVTRSNVTLPQPNATPTQGTTTYPKQMPRVYMQQPKPAVFQQPVISVILPRPDTPFAATRGNVTTTNALPQPNAPPTQGTTTYPKQMQRQYMQQPKPAVFLRSETPIAATRGHVTTTNALPQSNAAPTPVPRAYFQQPKPATLQQPMPAVVTRSETHTSAMFQPSPTTAQSATSNARPSVNNIYVQKPLSTSPPQAAGDSMRTSSTGRDFSSPSQDRFWYDITQMQTRPLITPKPKPKTKSSCIIS